MKMVKPFSTLCFTEMKIHHYTNEANGVSITIIFGENGTISTAFPSQKQPGGIKK